MQSFINYTKILYQLETNIMLYSKCYAKHNGLSHSLSHTQGLHELSIDYSVLMTLHLLLL